MEKSKQHTAACCSENKNHYIYDLCLTEKPKVILPDTQSATLSLSTDNYLTKVSQKDCAIFGPQFETFNRNLLISCQSRSRFLLPHELQYSAINILTLLQQSIKI